MEAKKCSSKKHEGNNAIYYCSKCKIYMCNKCLNNHSELFQNHNLIKLDKDINLIFTGFCNKENHFVKLEYFCKNHNILCCDSCISKIKKNGKGEHHDCDVCLIQDIKEEKKNKLNDNLKCLEDLSKTLNNSVNKLKTIFEKINEDKEKIKLEIANIFTKIRNIINEREDEVLLEIDKQFEKFCLNEKIIKDSETLPNKVSISIEKGKNIEKEWNNENKLCSLINDCINIEKNIKDINIINNNIKNINNYNNNIKIKFLPNEEPQINEFLEKIKLFGDIYTFNHYNIFKDSSILNINVKYEFIIKFIENRNYKIKESKLIYKATRDGDNNDNFFSKCNEVQNIILIIKTNNNCTFGGYTKVGFKKSNNAKYKDDEAFVFSLDNNKIYPIIKGKDAIRCCDCCGPQFSDNTIYLRNNFYSRTDNYVNQRNDNYQGFTKDYELNNGNKNFGIKEMEVFQLIFE